MRIWRSLIPALLLTLILAAATSSAPRIVVPKVALWPAELPLSPQSPLQPGRITGEVTPLSADLPLLPCWIAEIDQAGANFGGSVSTAGDVNGDGYDDVLVGARNYDNGQTNEGGAFVYYGSPTGTSLLPDWTAEGNQSGAWFGRRAETAGDVNGDGYDDIIVGVQLYDNGQTNEGRAYVYLGAATGLSTAPAWTMEVNQGWAYYGRTVGTAGDINGDGYDDILVGARLYDNGQTDEGRAYLYHGSPTGPSLAPDWIAEGNQAGAHFSEALGTAGDVNGDGYDDVIIGALYYHNGQVDEGRVYVYLGSAVGLSTEPDWAAEGNQAGGHFGTAVGTVGDVNGDGYDDVVIGAPYYDGGLTDAGAAFIYHGSPTGLSSTPDWVVVGDQSAANYGNAVGLAGDVNDDGYDDVIVAAQWYDNGQVVEGKVYLYLGSAAGVSTTPAWSDEGEQANAWYGCSLGTAGDVDADGYDDFIVGARDYDNGETDEGRAYLYCGMSDPCEPVTATAFAWTPLTPTVGQSVTFTGTATGTLPLTFTWAFGDEGMGSGAIVQHTYAAPGDYTATLTVTNECGEEVVTATLTVIPACDPVTGTAFVWTPVTPTVGQAVTFTGTATGTLPLVYTWALSLIHI